MDTPGKPTLILIVGPTAVGKSEYAIRLAERLDGELVSADSRLFYRGMDIGTAKPTDADRRRAPHHLIDIADPDQTLSLADFQRLARQAILDIHARGRLPLLVGGTGQYVRAVTQGWEPPAVRPDARLRAVLEEMERLHGGTLLYRRLGAMDPAAAEKIDRSNVRRTVRALEVILKTGRRSSEQRGSGESPFHVVAIGLRRPRPELYARLDARIDDMFAAGLLDEVRALLAKGYLPNLPSMSAIGYRECIKVVRGQMQVEGAKAEIRRLTRIFVRRQSNWFRESDPGIKWFDAADAGLVETVEAFVRQATGLKPFKPG
jgi:tRNA dimethylallyltransferase